MKTTGAYPRVRVDTADVPAIGHAGGVLLTETARASGLGAGLSTALRAWREPLAVHDPGKVILDLAVTLALGGDDGFACRVGGLVVDGAELLRAVPSNLDWEVSFVGVERGLEPLLLSWGEVFAAGAEQGPDPVQRVALAAAMPVDVLLHPTADLVDRGGAELDRPYPVSLRRDLHRRRARRSTHLPNEQTHRASLEALRNQGCSWGGRGVAGVGVEVFR